jgi:parvulin-like peptidyl-prolyl isomerase
MKKLNTYLEPFNPSKKGYIVGLLLIGIPIILSVINSNISYLIITLLGLLLIYGIFNKNQQNKAFVLFVKKNYQRDIEKVINKIEEDIQFQEDRLNRKLERIHTSEEEIDEKNDFERYKRRLVPLLNFLKEEKENRFDFE